MEDDLAAEIAKIEAELEADCQLREKQQLQPQQPQQFPSTGVIPAFGGMPAHQQHQQQAALHHHHQHQQMFPNSQQTGVYPFVHQQQQQLQQQQQQQQLQQQSQSQQQMGGSSIATSAAAQAHQFSKDSDGRSIFVGNLPRGENGGPTSTPEELTEFFSDCGQILNCTVLRDRTTGELKGTAYVEFASYTGMGRAIDTKNNANFKGSTIIVTKKRSAFRPERARGGRGGRGAAAGNTNNSADPYQAMMALMGMMASGAMMQRGGRGRGGRGSRGAATHYNNNNNAPAGFQPFQ